MVIEWFEWLMGKIVQRIIFIIATKATGYNVAGT